MGGSAARRHHDFIERQVLILHLGQKFTRRNHVTQSAEGFVSGRQVDDIGPPATALEFCRDLIEAPVGACLVFALGIGMKGRAEYFVQKHVAGVPIEWVIADHAFFKLDVAFHACGPRRRCGKLTKFDCTAPVMRIVSAAAAWASPM